MQIFHLTQKGYFHPTYCEDFLFVEELAPELFVAAVMDGCSMGQDSHFASALLGKLLKKACKELSYLEFAKEVPSLATQALPDLSKELIHRIFLGLRHTQNELFLEKEELLSTLIIAIIHTHKHQVRIEAFGDGVFVHKQVYEIDQGNKPDYMAYHLSEDFESWYRKQTQHWLFEDLHELGLSTDGILAFEKLDKTLPNFSIDIPSYLLMDKRENQKAHTLQKKIELLQEQHGWIATDDLAMVKMYW